MVVKDSVGNEIVLGSRLIVIKTSRNGKKNVRLVQADVIRIRTDQRLSGSSSTRITIKYSENVTYTKGSYDWTTRRNRDADEHVLTTRYSSLLRPETRAVVIG